MQTNTITIEAASAAGLFHKIIALEHDTYATIQATHNGETWCKLDVKPLTNTRRSAFPLDANGDRGDDRKRGQQGVIYSPMQPDNLFTVIKRARKMHK